MFTFFRWVFSLVSRRRLHNRTKAELDHPLSTQNVAIPYALTAFIVLFVQSLAATVGSLELVISDLPTPISYQAGRAIHLNFSVLWPLIGLMGFVYYFFAAEAEHNLASARLARWQYWIITLSFVADIIALGAGLTTGREYMEALAPFKIGVALSLGLFLINLIGTLCKPGVERTRPTLLAPLAGILFSLLLLIPNIPFLRHPVADEAVKFWVVHLWEEGTLELCVTGVAAALFLRISKLDKRKTDTVIWIETSLVLLTGFLATGHHYYWIGLPTLWHWVGAAFSVLQVTPFLFLTYTAIRSLGSSNWSKTPGKYQVCYTLLVSSAVYHLLGAGMLGLALAIPNWSRYAHGTYLVSLHAHLALFGALGMLVLGGCYFVLTEFMEPNDQEVRKAHLGVWLVNGGLLIMSGALAITGMLQIYLWRVTGLDYMQTQKLLWPYLMLRGLGGGVFASGSTLLMWSIGTMVWRERAQITKAVI